MIERIFGFVASTPPPPRPPLRPPAPPMLRRSSKPISLAPLRPLPLIPRIVGQWKDPKGHDMTEFRDDGLVIEHPAGGEAIRGRYSLHGQKLHVKLDGLSDELSFTVSLEPNRLEMTSADGQVSRYDRA